MDEQGAGTRESLRRRLLGHYPVNAQDLGLLPYGEHVDAVEARDTWRRFLAESPFSRDVGLYVHVPFCLRLCTFCDCSRDEWLPEADLDAYLALLFAEMDWFREVFADRALDRCYIGGGTPNLLSPAQLGRLWEGIDARFRFRPDALRCVEFAPELTTPERLQAVAARGVGRVSFGVQSLNDAVLRAVNRPGTNAERVHESLVAAQAAGLAERNADLIYGLADEEDASFERGLRLLVADAPTTITLQLLNNSAQARVYADEAREAATAERFVDFVAGLLPRLREVAPAYEAHLRPRTVVLTHRAMARDWRAFLDFYSSYDRVGVNTLGIGTYAHSRMHGGLRYQTSVARARFDAQATYEAARYTPALDQLMDAACALVTEGGCDLEALARRYGRLEPWLLEEVRRHVEARRLRMRGYRALAVPGTGHPLLALLERTTATLQASAAAAAGRGSLAVAHGVERYVVHFEPATPSRRYFGEVGGLGVYYARVGSEARDETIAPLLADLLAALRGAPAAGAEGAATRALELARRHFAQSPGWSLASALVAVPAPGTRQTAGPRRLRVLRTP